MTKIALVPVFALLPILLLASACGPTRYIPIEMLSPRPLEDPAFRMGVVEAELRIGRDWLEVLLHNPGPTPVWIDWEQASFTEPTGEAHFLFSSARIAQSYQYLYSRQSSLHNGHGAFMPVSIPPLDGWVEHRLLSVLEHETREIPVVLKAGESMREVLYPAEHVRVGEGGVLSFGSLFCGRGAGVGNERTFSVRIPVRKTDHWEIVTLVARLR